MASHSGAAIEERESSAALLHEAGVVPLTGLQGSKHRASRCAALILFYFFYFFLPFSKFSPHFSRRKIVESRV